MTDQPTIWAPDLLRGRTALVTGGGTGIGYGIAEALARAGASVVIAARRLEILEASAQTLRRDTDAEIAVDHVNIRDLESVQALADRHGAVDILVNNAGGHFAQKARDFSPNGWRTVIDLNLNGTWNMTQAFGDRMLSGNGGTICHVLMTIGHGIPGLAHSSAARSAVMELTRTLSYEWGPRVRLNAIAPGQVHTTGWDETYEEGVGTGVGDQPLGYAGAPSDMGNAVVFLVSPASRFITGQLLYVDGGLVNNGLMSALPDGGYPERELPPIHR